MMLCLVGRIFRYLATASRTVAARYQLLGEAGVQWGPMPGGSLGGGGGGGGLYSEVQYIKSNGHMGPILKLRMRAVTILCGMELVVH